MKYQSLYRIVVIVWMSVKFFIQLEYFRRKSKHSWDQDRWQKLLKKQAKEYKEKAIRLEGLLVKLGQFLSTRADILPKVFLEEIEDLVDRVPSFPWEKAKRILEEEWSSDYKDVIKDLSESSGCFCFDRTGLQSKPFVRRRSSDQNSSTEYP